jgi:hypothetical protein
MLKERVLMRQAHSVIAKLVEELESIGAVQGSVKGLGGTCVAYAWRNALKVTGLAGARSVLTFHYIDSCPKEKLIYSG